jgi:hypothetical protein
MSRMPNMKRGKRKRLEAAGWRLGDAKEFLDLTDDESALIEVKLQLANALRVERSKAAGSPCLRRTTS